MWTQNNRVLVLDDERVVLDSVSRVLEGADYEVQTHQSGEKALESLKESEFGLFITDLKMPGMDGLHAIKEIKSVKPELPVIMLTAYADVDSAKEAMKLGAADYIKKPFTPEQLLEVVNRIMESREELEQRAYRRETFEEVKAAAASTLKLRKALDIIVKGAVKTFRTKGATISLLDKTGKELKVCAYYGLGADYVSKGPLDSSASIGDVILNGRPALISDTSNDSRVQYPKEAQREGVASILSAPLIVEDRVIGALRLYSGQKDGFDDANISFLQEFAAHLSSAIENARKYEDVQSEYDNLMDDLWDYFDTDGWL